MSTTPRLIEDFAFAWCDDRYRHIWEAVSKLSKADPRLGVAVDCLDVSLEVAQSKAHKYARRFKMPVTCRTRVVAGGIQLLIKRCPEEFIRGTKQDRETSTTKIKAREVLNYSFNCSRLMHDKCKGSINVNKHRAECKCPCHRRGE
jgi:hypothetical protein